MEKVVSKNSKDEEMVFYVVHPDAQAQQNAKNAFSKAFTKALDNGAMLKDTIKGYLIKQGLWNDDKQKELESLQKSINDDVKSLKAGGIDLEEAKNIAINVRRNREKLLVLVSRERSLDAYTAEAQGEDASFLSLVADCTVTEKGEKIFKNVEDYMNKSEEPYAVAAATKLSEMTLGLDPEWEQKLPENRFLLEYKFCDNDLRLINEEGKHVSVDGKLIDEFGNYIDEEGNKVNKFGDLIDENGEPIIDFKPFTKNGEEVK